MHCKKDANHFEITTALQAVGASVYHLHKVGAGFPDVAVGFRKVNYLIEIKTSEGTLTKLQRRWMYEWKGTYHVVRTVEEALRAIGATK